MMIAMVIAMVITMVIAMVIAMVITMVTEMVTAMAIAIANATFSSILLSNQKYIVQITIFYKLFFEIFTFEKNSFTAWMDLLTTME